MFYKTKILQCSKGFEMNKRKCCNESLECILIPLCTFKKLLILAHDAINNTKEGFPEYYQNMPINIFILKLFQNQILIPQQTS